MGPFRDGASASSDSKAAVIGRRAISPRLDNEVQKLAIGEKKPRQVQFHVGRR